MYRLLLLFFLVACSSKKDEPKPEPKPAPASIDAATAPPPPAVDAAVAAAPVDAVAPAFDFDKLSFDEQKEFMKKNVMPAMKKAFQEFDAEHYKVFNCKTCHGKDPEKVKFKMPSPDLPKLDFKALEAGKQKPKIAEWMGKTIKPDMAKILQMPEYNESNPKGFGCLHCHEQKK
jgi:hypothetical protein